MKHAEGSVSSLRAQAEALGVPISAKQSATILELESALRDRAPRFGALSASDVVRLRERHTLDSLRAAAAVRREDQDAYDLGSGAGLPGIPVAVARPALKVVLVERRHRKAAFLEWLVELLDVPNARVQASPIEDLSSRVDVCFARAVAPIERAWDLAEPLLRPQGRLVYFAGRGAPLPGPVPGAETRVVPPEGPLLERAGSLVIMTRE